MELRGGESDAAALLVTVNSNGGVTETPLLQPTATDAALVAAANRACAARTRAVAALPTLPSLQQTGRLIPIEHRFEAALVSVGPVRRPPGPPAAIAPSWFLSYFLNYEQHLIDFHRHVLQNEPLSLTQSDLGATRGAEAALTQTANQDGIHCDFRTYLQPPPAQTIPRHTPPPRPTPRSSINAPQT